MGVAYTFRGVSLPDNIYRAINVEIHSVVATSTVIMGKKSRKPKAPSGKGPTGVAKAEVDTTMSTPAREPEQRSTPQNCEIGHFRW